MYLKGMGYDQMTTNIAKCINLVLKDARALSMIAFLDHIRSTHEAWFVERKEIALNRETVLSDHRESLLKLVDLRSKRYVVRPIDHYELEIVDDHINPCINLHDKTCMCGKFSHYEIPCSHALAACRVWDIELYTLCFHAYYVTS
ncbi:MuDR family transposase [Cucumis melo var. makuwa]|uniref:MuDR family transposase n=1 Tax=Cucumis melo var. makuwa TaxID=1194695 RepID=A0A5A7U8L2_CUCMM|nr:MuDR family transposase [Cucumis melo var. makuwa]TYK07673.1 MuDR family transposase [Cucumis melo var. makuwa]